MNPRARRDGLAVVWEGGGESTNQSSQVPKEFLILRSVSSMSSLGLNICFTTILHALNTL